MQINRTIIKIYGKLDDEYSKSLYEIVTDNIFSVYNLGLQLLQTLAFYYLADVNFVKPKKYKSQEARFLDVIDINSSELPDESIILNNNDISVLTTNENLDISQIDDTSYERIS